MTEVSEQGQPRTGRADRSTTSPATKLYDVGGIGLPRPFKIRRFGHFGYNCGDLEAMLDFYVDGLGLLVSDRSPRMASRLPTADQDGLSPMERLVHFTRFGSEHHQLVFISQKVWDRIGRENGSDGMSINQITWQVGSLAEVVAGSEWIAGRGERLMRSGRDMPGSNWHTYLFDPEGNINELYYGMEQVGWDGLSKPREMWSTVRQEAPDLPQPSEASELEQGRRAGIDMASGHRLLGPTKASYPVDGVVLDRPFKVVGIRPVSLFVNDLDAAVAFYTETLGFSLRKHVVVDGMRGAFLSHGADHHSLALYDVSLRTVLGMGQHRRTLALGFQLANYRQLRAAVEFMTARGAEEVEIPVDLVPGFDFVTHLRDPDGNLAQLYYYQRQCGPSGTAPETVSGNAASWPAIAQAQDDVFGGQQFFGPWQ